MPTHENLAAALAAFQAELPKLTKDQSAKVTGETQSGAKISYTYGYADLSQVTGEVSPVLGKHGLSFTSFPTVDGNTFILKYALLHEGGEKIEGVWPLPDPIRIKPQQLGSAITYARRYAFLAVTNTFPGGEDDDGAAAVPTSHRDQAMNPADFDKLPRERPGNAPTSPAAPPVPKTWTDEEVVSQHAKLEALDLDKAGALYDWMASKGLHTRAVGGTPDIPAVNATTRLAVRMAAVAQDPALTVANLSWIRELADTRGLLKTPVAPDLNLSEALEQRKAKINAAAEVAKSDNAAAMQTAAADSWDDPTPGAAGSSE